EPRCASPFPFPWRPLLSPSTANCGESPTLIFRGSEHPIMTRRQARLYWLLGRRGCRPSAFLRLAASQVFPQFHGQAMAAVRRLLGLAGVLPRTRHAALSACRPLFPTQLISFPPPWSSGTFRPL